MNDTEYCLFETSIGHCGIGWTYREQSPVVTLFQLPEETPERTEARIAGDAGASHPSDPPPKISAILQKVRKHLDGQPQDFRSVPLLLDGVGAFTREVYAAAQEIPSGQTRTYGDLARALGQPGAARAVGQAMGSNPIPLLIPCHRILAAGGKSGGFSAHGGRSTKSALLSIEGVSLGPHPTLKAQKDFALAAEALKSRDPKLALCMNEPIAFKTRGALSPYESLFEAIVHQQLSTKVVTTILGRVKDLYPGSVIPEPEDLLKTPDQLLREAGLSGAKVASVKDLAAKTLHGIVPTSKEIIHLGDEEIVQRLTAIRGIGRWTVEMMLIFHLGRADVFPVDDFAIRKAYGEVYGMSETPTAKQLLPMGDVWKPYRTVASLYLWDFLSPKEVEQKAEMETLF